MTAWPTVGQLSEDRWTESERKDTKPDSDSLTNTGGLTLVPPVDDGSTTAEMDAEARGSLFVDAPAAEPGSLPSEIPEPKVAPATSAGTRLPCRRCRKEKEPERYGWYCETCAPIAYAERLHRQRLAERARSKKRATAKKNHRRVTRKPCPSCGGRMEPRRFRRCAECQRKKDEAQRVKMTTCYRCEKRPRRGKGYRLCVECASRSKYQPRKQPPEFPLLPSAPLANKVRRIINQERSEFVWTNENGKLMQEDPTARICGWLRIDPKTFRNWETGYRPHVQFELADRIISKTGWNWFDIYEGDERCDDGRTVAEIFEPERTAATA